MKEEFDFEEARRVVSGAPAVKQTPPDDPVVSKIVGKPVKVNDRRLLNLVVKWKKEKNNDEVDDNFFSSQEHIDELKATFI